MLPGEVAPAHRHSPAAIRFVIEGQGAFTTVDGDKCVMERGDLVLTPPWTWHDHGNDSDRPMLWLDGLDLPMVGEMEAQFYEPFAEEAQPIEKPVGDSERRYGVGQLRPTWETWTASHSPLLNYKWDRTEEALRRLASVAGGASAFDDVAMEYVNPRTGGPLMPTMACWIQLLRPGVRTKAHRQTGSAVYLVFEGRGQTVVDGQRFDWRKGDLFVVPTWAWHEHASVDGEAVLFSVHDTPIMQGSRAPSRAGLRGARRPPASHARLRGVTALRLVVFRRPARTFHRDSCVHGVGRRTGRGIRSTWRSSASDDDGSWGAGPEPMKSGLG